MMAKEKEKSIEIATVTTKQKANKLFVFSFKMAAGERERINEIDRNCTKKQHHLTSLHRHQIYHTEFEVDNS